MGSPVDLCVPCGSGFFQPQRSQRYTRETQGRIHLPKRTVTCDPTATCAPGRGDCSRATPLPTASRSSPTSCAASIAPRRFLPRNDGTSIPPSSTSRTTTPLDGNFCVVEFSDCPTDGAAVELATAVVEAVRAAGTT